MLDVRVLGIWLLAVTVLLAASVFLLQVDDPLDARAQHLLDQAQPRSTSDAYFLLMGIVASEQDDPVRAGRTLFASIQRAEQQSQGIDTPFSYDDYPEQKRLPLPDGKWFCRTWEPGCIEQLFEVNPSLDQMLDEHRVLLSRYQAFGQTNDYATLTHSLLKEPIPPFQYLGKASRLVVLDSIRMARESPARALDQLLENMAMLRRQLAQQDLLIGKILLLMQISEHLDVATLIARRSDHALLTKIPVLDARERDFLPLMSREFAMSVAMFRSMDRHPGIFREDDPLPGWVVRMLFKPNMMSNAVLPLYLQAVEDAHLSSADFARRLQQKDNSKDTNEAHSSWQRNWIGSRLEKFAAPDYDTYVARFHDLDGKIRLFNALAGQQDLEAVLVAMQADPAWRDTMPHWSEHHKSLCMDGPLPDERQLRCLRTDL